MKLNWKKIGIGVGAVVGTLVLAAILFVVFFPKDLAAREAERRIEAATGRDLTLGRIEISLWPALGFSADSASLSNPDGFSAEHPFIAADRIVFAVALAPLLRGAIQVKQLIFEGAQIRLEAKEDGAANWAFPTENTSEAETTIEDLRLDDVRLVDSMVSFQGGADQAPLVLQHVDASLALQSLDQPARVAAAFDYRDRRVEIEGDIGLPRAVLEKSRTPISMRVASDALSATLEGAFDASNGALSGQIDARGDSVRSVLAWVGSPMADGGGFNAFSVAGAFVHEAQTTQLTDATLRLDDIAARGNVNLTSQADGRLLITGALAAPNVDLNTYLPPPAQGAEAAGVQVETAWSQAPLDFSGLRALDANIDLTIGALRFQRMNFSDATMNLRVANGAADARLSRISLYGGVGVARLIADGSGATPRLAVELDVQNIAAEPLLRDAIGFDRITGRGRLRASLVGQGPSQAAVMRNLNGSASFSFNDGQWKGVNLAQIARTVQSALTGQTQSGGGATDFAELSSTFTIADGVAATDNLRLLNPFVRLEGAGLINIGAQTIDMRIAPRAVRSIEGQGGDAALAGLGIPFRVSGPWSHVSFRPALEEVAQSQLRSILSRQQEGSPLARLGEALFGRAPAASPAATQTPAPGSETENASEAPAPQQQQEQRPRNPLEDILRRAVQGQEKQAEPPAQPAPTP